MSPDRFERANEIFLRVLEISEGDRGPFLDSACGDDADLRGEVEELLAADREAPAILASKGPVGLELPRQLEDARSAAGEAATGLEGSEIGPFRVLELIGEGSFGEVYVAEQTKPIRRRVALKVLKAGLDTKAVLTRFEAERQALAMMDHPNVARVIDAGATDRGRPYFAMELIRGEPITTYCDRYRLPTRERLDLFIPICRAIQHAHQKGIIHRDLKPSNVLVSLVDGQPVPKVIDFGVAKAVSTSSALTDKTLHTLRGQMIGTPAYMSPEQAEMTGLEVDTTTDVYSLGVLLYELLTGALPFDTRVLLEAGVDAMLQIIREVEPQKPSTRVSSLGEEVSKIAVRRRTEPNSLQRQMRGELDWITMMAMDKDPSRRYASPSEFAADIARFLRNEPVVASPPSTRYRMRKFVRRHGIAVAATATAFLLLAGVATTMTLQARRIALERDRANREAETSRQVATFLTGLFRVSDPSEARGNTITAREILDRGVEDMRESLHDQPEVRARLLGTMGDVYRELGLFEEADPLLKEALDTRRSALGEIHPATLTSMNNLGLLYSSQGRYQEAEPLYVAALAGMRRELGDDDPETLRCVANLGSLYLSLRRYEEAEPLHLEALDSRRRALGDDHSETLQSVNNLAGLYMGQSRFDEAEPLYREALAAGRRMLGDEHPQTLLSMNNLANLYSYQGRDEAAEPLYVEALAAQRRILGNAHPDALITMNNLATLYQRLGQNDEARPLLMEALSAQRRVLGDDHAETLMSKNNLANVYFDEKPEEAERLYREALAGWQGTRGGDDPHALEVSYNLACLLATLGRSGEAVALLRHAVDQGFAEPYLLEDDDLARLSGEPGFDAILAEVRRRNGIE